MVKPKQLGHLVLRVRDLEVSKTFYASILDLRVTYEIPGKMVFMSAGESSHELALMEAGPNASGSDNSQLGLYHFAWEMNTLEDLKILNEELKDKEVQIVGVGDHGISIGVYFLDPDSNEIEAFYELPPEQWPDQDNLFSGKFPKGNIENYSNSSSNKS